MRQFSEIMEEMRKTFPSRDGSEGEEYVFFKKQKPTDKRGKRLLQEDEFFLFEFTSTMMNNNKQVQSGEHQYAKYWAYGYFINTDNTRINSDPVRITFTPAVARNIESYQKKFKVKFQEGVKARFFTNNYDGTYGRVYSVGIGILKDKTQDTTVEKPHEVTTVTADEIEIDDELL